MEVIDFIPADMVDLRQTYRTNEQMMQAMKGATMALGSMNKSMNLPQLQRIAMEFERENDIMEQRQEMMDDAVDDAMDVGVEEEGDEVVEQVLEEIGVDLGQAVSTVSTFYLSRGIILPVPRPILSALCPLLHGLEMTSSSFLPFFLSLFSPSFFLTLVQMGETPNELGNPAIAEGRIAQAVGGGGGGGGDPVDDDLQARLDSLKK